MDGEEQRRTTERMCTQHSTFTECQFARNKALQRTVFVLLLPPMAGWMSPSLTAAAAE